MDITEAHSAVHNLVSSFEGLVSIRDALKAALDAETAQRDAESKRDFALVDLARVQDEIAVVQQKRADLESAHVARIFAMEIEIKALVESKQDALFALDDRIDVLRASSKELELAGVARMNELSNDYESRKTALNDEIVMLVRARDAIRREIAQAGVSLSP